MSNKIGSSTIYRKRSIYAAYNYTHAFRARFTPRVKRHMRAKVIAWAGPTAFNTNRFYNLDKWYKARITKPIIYPELHVIDPDDYHQSLEERLSDGVKNINIGFQERKYIKPAHGQKDEAMLLKMESDAVANQLDVDVSLIPFRPSLNVFKLNGIFRDLFIPGVYFNMVQDLNVFYGKSEVALGNHLCPSLAVEKPDVKIESLSKVLGKSEAYNTLFMLNMDGDFFEKEPEEGYHPSVEVPDRTQMLHWLVGNIPDGQDVSNGDELVPYLQPLIVKGAGYHRVAFVLFRHKNKLDFCQLKLNGQHLSERVFRLNRLYKKHENDDFIPTAVKFCHMKYHETCKQTLESLGMKVPTYFYEWNQQLPPPSQREYPEKPMPFNMYFEQYRSRKSIEKEMAKRRLERLVHEGKCEKAKFPDYDYGIHRKEMQPWQHTELMKENVGLGKYALLYQTEIVNAAEQAEMEAEGKLDPHKPEFEKAALLKL